MKSYQQSEQIARDLDAEKYESWYINSKWSLFDERERIVFSESVWTGDCLLDLWCGTGRITEEFVGRYPSIYAVDFSPKSIEILEAKELQWVSASVMDATTMFPFQDAQFDTVISCQVIQHFQLDDLYSCLSEVHRTLKNEWELVFSVYNYDYFLFKNVFEEIFSNGLYVKRFNTSMIHSLMRHSGFEVCKLSYYAVNPILHKSSGRWNYILEIILSNIPYIRRKLGRYLLVHVKKHA